MSSNEPVKNGCEVIYEMFHILNCDDHGLLNNELAHHHVPCDRLLQKAYSFEYG